MYVRMCVYFFLIICTGNEDHPHLRVLARNETTRYLHKQLSGEEM